MLDCTGWGKGAGFYILDHKCKTVPFLEGAQILGQFSFAISDRYGQIYLFRTDCGWRSKCFLFTSNKFQMDVYDGMI